jgi:hypothetical protein
MRRMTNAGARKMPTATIRSKTHMDLRLWGIFASRPAMSVLRQQLAAMHRTPDWNRMKVAV